MKKIVVLFLASMMAASALAGLDPDADSFGVYIDTNGDNNCIGPISTTTKTVYIILSNPSTVIKGFELAYEIVPDAYMAPTFADDFLRMSQTISGAPFVDLGTSTDPTIGDFRCGYAVARPIVPAMVMVTWKFRYYGEEDLNMAFYLRGVATNASGPSDGYPVVDGGTGIGLRQAGIASGDRLMPVAWTTWCWHAQESITFGSVKSLFR